MMLPQAIDQMSDGYLFALIVVLALLALIAGASIWTGVVNHIERRHRMNIESRKLALEEQKQADEAWDRRFNKEGEA